MERSRQSRQVITQLLASMQSTVTSYHPSVGHTGDYLEDLIAGTACFPGGSGLWRGAADGGPLPEFFPDAPIMFVAHNFDSQNAYTKSVQRRGEASQPFWKCLLHYIEAADLEPSQCFFTNALMGLKPGSATGPMPKVPGYIQQCSRFLQVQADIVQPRAVIALGVNAAMYVPQLGLPWLEVKHPSHWDLRPLATRKEIQRSQGKLIANLLADL